MKIAVSCNGNQIWAHFGHCENFMVYETENGVITSEESVPIRDTDRDFCRIFLRIWV